MLIWAVQTCFRGTSLHGNMDSEPHGEWMVDMGVWGGGLLPKDGSVLLDSERFYRQTIHFPGPFCLGYYENDLKCSSTLMGPWTWPECARVGVGVGRCYLPGILEAVGDNAVSGPLPSRNYLVDYPFLGRFSNRHRRTDHHFLQLVNIFPEGEGEHLASSSCPHSLLWPEGCEPRQSPQCSEGLELSLLLLHCYLCTRAALRTKLHTDLRPSHSFGR